GMLAVRARWIAPIEREIMMADSSYRPAKPCFQPFARRRESTGFLFGVDGSVYAELPAFIRHGAKQIPIRRAARNSRFAIIAVKAEGGGADIEIKRAADSDTLFPFAPPGELIPEIAAEAFAHQRPVALGERRRQL